MYPEKKTNLISSSHSPRFLLDPSTPATLKNRPIHGNPSALNQSIPLIHFLQNKQFTLFLSPKRPVYGNPSALNQSIPLIRFLQNKEFAVFLSPKSVTYIICSSHTILLSSQGTHAHIRTRARTHTRQRAHTHACVLTVRVAPH